MNKYIFVVFEDINKILNISEYPNDRICITDIHGLHLMIMVISGNPHSI